MIPDLVLRPLLRAWSRLTTGSSRGDVPGWVLITVMTAGLVSVLYVLAKDQLSELFRDAVRSVQDP